MPTFRTRLTVALVSAATIALELMLMRILSLRFWHHFSFMIISTALLGFGASGTALALARRLVVSRRREALCATALAMALAVPLSIRAAELIPLNVQFLTWDFRQVGYLVLVELIFLFPLMLAGAAVGLALMDEPRRIGGHYAANLIGSGAGAALAVILLGPLTTPQVVVVLAGLAFLAGLISLPKRRLWLAGGAAAGAALLAVHLLLPWSPGMSQYKMLSLLKQMPGTETIHRTEGPLGRIDVIAGPAIHEVPPGYSPVSPEAIGPHVLIITDGDQTSPVFEADSDAGYAFLDWTAWALPYRLAENPSVLILGAGGGADIGLARYHRCRRIIALEMNEQVIEIMTGPLRRRGGDIYRAPGVDVINLEARGYLAGGGERFDLIQPAFVRVSAAGERAACESYLYTIEAFERMLDRLRPGGMINVACEARTPSRGGLRLFATAASALRRTGRQPREHLAMIRALGVVNITVFASPISTDRGRAIRAFCKSRNFDLCFLPDLKAEEANHFHLLDRAYYYEAASAILGPKRRAFFDDYVFDVTATTDNRPYFYHFFRLRTLPMMVEQLAALSRSHLELGYILLLAVLVQSVPLAAVLILLPLIGRSAALRRTSGKGRAFGYFLLIGVGFMFIEMSFLQRLTLYLAHPLYSAAVVIGAFLVFAGIGSRLSQRWSAEGRVVIRRAGMIIVAVSIIYIFVLNELLRPTQGWPVWARAILAAMAVAPLGVAMGHMFPIALRRLGASRPALVPWCWAINGFASVVATVGAALLAMEVGFAAVAGMGAAAYLVALIVAVRFDETHRKPATAKQDR